MTANKLFKTIAFYALVVVIVVFSVFPFYWMFITTFRPDGELYQPWNSPRYQPFWTNNPTLEHIFYLFEETNFMRWMFNTMFIALVSTVISLFCGVLAGYAGPQVALALDATTLGSRFMVLAISVVYRGCGLPVAWAVLPAGDTGAGLLSDGGGRPSAFRRRHKDLPVMLSTRPRKGALSFSTAAADFGARH